MKLVIFYEKPGCVTNAKQKKSLQGAGCMLIVKNLLDHGMSKEELLTYLEHRPVSEWFNPNAPAVRNKKIDPGSFTRDEALPMLFRDPILIRRPLISVEGRRMCGFDKKVIGELLDTDLDIDREEKCSGKSEAACPPPVSPSTPE